MRDVDRITLRLSAGIEAAHWASVGERDAPDTIGRHLLDALRRTEAEMKQGALQTIEPARARLRLLPLRLAHSRVD